MEKLVEVALNQAPEVYEQFLFMARADNVGWFAVCVVTLSLCAIAIKKAKVLDEEPAMLAFLVSGAFGALAALGLFCNAVDFVVSLKAPKATAIREVLHHASHK